ncbi:putative PGG domain-containing protein [Medicago truncatula]|nr:putative PGG domain-containing protein [Medicago truncatula]
MDKILIYVLHIRKDISKEEHNSFLIVATLIATATYQTTLPGGVYQGNAGDHNINNVNTTSLNSNATMPHEYVGKSVINESEFFSLSIFNTVSLLLSTMKINLLTPSRSIGGLLFTPMFWFAYCYINNMRLISPTSATSTLNLAMVIVCTFFYSFVYWSFLIVYKRLKSNGKNKELKIRNRIVGNKW